MSKLLLVGLLVLFSVHFISEVFVEDKRLQTLINNAAGIGLILWFLLAVVGLFLFGA